MRIYLYLVGFYTFFNFFCNTIAFAQNDVGVSGWNTLKNRIEIHLHQNTDSLHHYLMLADSVFPARKINNEKRLFLQNAWGVLFSGIHQSDSAILFFRKALNAVKQDGDQNLVNNQRIRLAEAFNDKYLADSALKYYREALPYFRENNDMLTMAAILSGMATALIESGNNKAALEKLYEAESIYKTTESYRELGVIYDNMAMINAELGYEKKTKKYGQKAIALYQKAGDTLLLADAYANLGVSYKNLNQCDSALYFYNKSNTLARQINNKWLLAKNMHNIGVVHDVTGNHEKASAAFKASLEICRQQNFPYGEFNNSVNLGDHEINLGDLQQAIRYFERAAEIGKKHGFDDLGLVYDKLHLAYAKSGNNRRALKYLRTYTNYRDSAFRAQKHQEIMELQTRYETQKREAQILKLQKEKQSEKLWRAYLLLGLVAVIIVALLLLMRSRQKQARTKQSALLLEKENQQKQNQMERLRLEKKLQEKAAEKYRLDLKLKEQELVFRTLKETGLNHIMKKINEKLGPFTYSFSRKKDREHFEKTLQEIAYDTTIDPLADFEEMFLQMHGDFYEKLLAINPDFTRSELQMAALLRMNLPSKEIANLLNLALSTIDKRRHHIRQKIGLASDQSLTGFLIGL